MQKRKKEGFALFFFTQLSFIIVYIIVSTGVLNGLGCDENAIFP